MNISNPNLIPEQSVNMDLAFVYQGQSSLLQLSTFRNQINHMVIIDWDYTKNPRTGTFKNIGKGLLYGVEFAYNQKISKHFSGDINLAQIYGYDLTTNDELMDVPPFQLNARIKYSFKNKLSLYLSGRYSAKQTNVAEDDFPNDEFTVFDFSMRWKILRNLNANFSVTNILNKEYREHYQFNWMHAPGRSFNFGVNFNF
jgi:outer membrane receptor protein involved in Fe transport